MGLIIPAIDLLGGQAVRLYKGDYEQKTMYSDNPVRLAQKFKAMGAQLLHIVDLDGAKTGENPNFETIKKIAEIIPIEVGGGIRSAEVVEKYLQFSQRIILGTIAIQKPEFVQAMADKYGKNRIIVGVDVKYGKVVTNGWLEDSGVDYLEFIDNLPVETIIVTDVSKDGTLTSPNWQIYERIKGKSVIVSGGVASNDDIINAKPYAGVIVGKAYYEGKVDLVWLLKNV